MRRALQVAIPTALLIVLAGSAAQAQDFQKTYMLPAGGQIRVGNISGGVKVSGYNGESIVVAGFKEGRDRDMVQVEDLSTGDRVDIRVRYPDKCNCDASVNFELRVPQNVEYNFDRISSVSGNVSLEGVSGKIRAESVSGNVDVTNVRGMLSASSVSGNVAAAVTHLSGSGEVMKFSSVSGNVSVKVPANLDADVEMSSVSGSLKTDFPIEVREPRYGPGRSARGRLGAGTNSLRITTVSGRVSLTRG